MCKTIKMQCLAFIWSAKVMKSVSGDLGEVTCTNLQFHCLFELEIDEAFSVVVAM